VFERDAAHPAGRVAFIASLPSSDSRLWSLNAGVPANVTPEGRFLVFPSHGRLTADDTSVSGAQQVFRYDADSGALVRISVGNNGFNDNGNRSAVHWDMVLIQRPEWGGGEVWFDGELIRKNGLFVPNDLKPLNPANLK